MSHFSNDVKVLLATEIVKRYQGQKGEIIYSLREDTDIKESYALLKDKKRYMEILSPKE